MLPPMPGGALRSWCRGGCSSDPSSRPTGRCCWSCWRTRRLRRRRAGVDAAHRAGVGVHGSTRSRRSPPSPARSDRHGKPSRSARSSRCPWGRNSRVEAGAGDVAGRRIARAGARRLLLDGARRRTAGRRRRPAPSHRCRRPRRGARTGRGRDESPRSLCEGRGTSRPLAARASGCDSAAALHITLGSRSVRAREPFRRPSQIRTRCRGTAARSAPPTGPVGELRRLLARQVVEPAEREEDAVLELREEAARACRVVVQRAVLRLEVELQRPSRRRGRARGRASARTRSRGSR